MGPIIFYGPTNRNVLVWSPDTNPFMCQSVNPTLLVSKVNIKTTGTVNDTTHSVNHNVVLYIVEI